MERCNGQVSNWFINARVRLWKPMVEEMYKEEGGEAGMESNSSSEIAPKNTKGGDRNHSEDQGETAASKSSNQGHAAIEMAGTSSESDFQNMMVNRGEHGRLMAAEAAAYQIPGRFGNGNGGGGGGGGGGGVSLTLGLQHCEDGSLPPMASNHHHGFVGGGGGGGGGVYDGGGESSVGPEAVDFDCVDSGNQQQRFGSSHLLHDFVA